MGAFDSQLARANDNAAQPQPLPLMADRAAAGDYPIDALGPVLAGAVRATAEHSMAPASIAAQSALAACSLAIQAHFDVRLPTGQTRPTSLFLVSVAESGDRKSTADDFVMSPIRDYENELDEMYRRKKVDAAMQQSAWDEAKKAATQRTKSKGRDAIEEAYRELGPRPEGPLEPTIIVRTGSTQGLLKRFLTTRPSLGLMSDEGGSWIGGFSMTEDQRLNTIATLSDFWDGKNVQTLTAGEGYTSLRGRRLAFHLMLQPIIAGKLLGDAEAQGQGFLSRLLVAHPESLAGTRFVDPDKELDPELRAAMEQYRTRLDRIIRAPLPADPDTNELKPQALPLSEQARLMWYSFYNAIEAKVGPNGELHAVKGFVGKLPEMAARMAACLAVFEQGYDVQEISAAVLARGIRLAEFYLSEAQRLFGAPSTPQIMIEAQMLADWLRDEWPENLVSVNTISQRGPNQLRRGADYVKSLIDILVRHEHLSEQLPNGGMVSGKKCRAAWRVQVRHG